MATTAWPLTVDLADGADIDSQAGNIRPAPGAVICLAGIGHCTQLWRASLLLPVGLLQQLSQLAGAAAPVPVVLAGRLRRAGAR